MGLSNLDDEAGAKASVANYAVDSRKRDGARARNRCAAVALSITCLIPTGGALAEQAEPVAESESSQSDSLAPPGTGAKVGPTTESTSASPTSVDTNAEPWRTDRFYLETSLYTHHFNSDPAHVNDQKLILGEWNITENWLAGGSFFDNSFGQPSQYFYGGYRFRPIASHQPFYVKVSAGLVHGYTGQYQNKIPFNHSGVAPAIVPSIGYCISRVCSEMVIFGGAGILLTLGVTIP